MARNATGSGGKKGKKNRKHLRNKMRSPSAKAYINEGRELKNKHKRLQRHLKKHSNDKQQIQVVDYKQQKFKPEQLAEYLANKRWKEYLKEA